MSRVKKPLPFRILRVLFIVLLILMIFLAAVRLYFRLPVASYYQSSRAAFEIPAIRDGFVPQGFEYDERSDLFLVSGYMDEKAPSPVYLVSRKDGSVRACVTLTDDKGKAYTGHSGGITLHGDYVYLAGGAAGICMSILTAS